MDINRRPRGRERALTQAAFATVKMPEKKDGGAPAAPMAIVARDLRTGARLIDLERRARFARLAF